MWTTYWFEIVGEDSEICGEEFFTELENATKEQHIAYAHEIFPNEKIVCWGKVTQTEAEMMGLDTYQKGGINMIEVTIKFDSCWNCPFKLHFHEQGYSGTECRFFEYTEIDHTGGTLECCPFKNKNDKRIKEHSSIIVSYNYTE